MRKGVTTWVRRSTRRTVAAVGLATAALLGGALGAIQLASAAGVPAVFVPVSPWRILETRASQAFRPANAHTLGPGEIYTLQVTGDVAGCPTPADCVPGDSGAVVLNLTVTNPTATSYLTLWPSDEGTTDRIEHQLGAKQNDREPGHRQAQRDWRSQHLQQRRRRRRHC